MKLLSTIQIATFKNILSINGPCTLIDIAVQHKKADARKLEQSESRSSSSQNQHIYIIQSTSGLII